MEIARSGGFRSAVTLLPFVLLLVSCAGGAGGDHDGVGKIPITTESDEARRLYLEGREMIEMLRGTDARQSLLRAVALDDGFALAHLALANSSPTAQEFFDSLDRAVERSANGVSDAERAMILAQNAGARGQPAAQEAYLEELVTLAPEDERAHQLLAVFHFGRQAYAVARDHFRRAVEINPGFSPPYNLMGYAERFLGNYEAAERAFQRYIELIPDEPNPYDSYAELLMKVGRFEESIENYERALQKKPTFIASYVGIGTNLILLGETEEARAVFRDLYDVARTDGERRQALLGNAVSRVADADYDAALLALRKRMAIAEETGDGAAIAADFNLIGTYLVNMGRIAEAMEQFEWAVEAIEAADVPDDVKQNIRRNRWYHESRAALFAGDLETAAARLAAYEEQVAENDIAFEVRRTHRLAGILAIEQGDYERALSELEQAGQRDAWIVYHTARAYAGLRDRVLAREGFEEAAEFNELNASFVWVRPLARHRLASM